MKMPSPELGVLLTGAAGRLGRFLILLRGRPGTGKSTVADALAKRLRAAVIDKDDIKDVMDARYRDEHIGGLCYEAMLRIVERCLSNGVSVVCDSPLTYHDLHDRAKAMAVRHGARAVTVRLICSDEVEWRRRIESRKEIGIPAHRVTDFASPHLSASERYSVGDEDVVDTARPIEAVIEDILRFVHDKRNRW